MRQTERARRAIFARRDFRQTAPAAADLQHPVIPANIGHVENRAASPSMGEILMFIQREVHAALMAAAGAVTCQPGMDGLVGCGDGVGDKGQEFADGGADHRDVPSKGAEPEVALSPPSVLLS